jgi:hypothetical protein
LWLSGFTATSYFDFASSSPQPAFRVEPIGRALSGPSRHAFKKQTRVSARHTIESSLRSGKTLHFTEKKFLWMLHFFENGSLGLPFCTKVSTTIITGYQHFDLVETRRFLTSSYESNRNTRLAD